MTTVPQIKERVFTASNLLSISRVLLLWPIVYYLYLGSTELRYNVVALWWMLGAGLTDTFDGMLARHLNQVTRLGVIIDPVADKICTAVIMGSLALFRPDFPVWLFAIAIARDLIIFSVGLYIRHRYGHIFMSNMLGKITMTVMAIAVIVYAIKDVWNLTWLYEWSLWATVILLVASSAAYAVRMVRFFSAKTAAQS